MEEVMVRIIITLLSVWGLYSLGCLISGSPLLHPTVVVVAPIMGMFMVPTMLTVRDLGKK